ncbi:MAG: hypothetical protein KDA27_17325 [Candidatus Eisenbacteria bacterium]|uniref:RNA polymerase sigma-70 ECF-like HTH domain-containing protein n=1 Tax=Eiseniibacteriota bacterium TaxID=2212470 RepID=A0A956NDS6_UNCEI|nr:hypothetical protein [Candidatus Eisenbacteria bacterium]
MSEAVSYPPDPDSFSRVDQLFLLCRSELERVAHSLMAKERKGHSLKSLDLLHEVYLRIRKARGLEIRNDVHFRRLMVRHMRWFLYTYASRNSVRKSSQIVGVDELDIELGGLNTERDPRRFLMLLDELAETSEEGARQAAYINMVFFVGISKGTAASRLGISDRQGRREWKEAKDWLEERLRGGPWA